MIDVVARDPVLAPMLAVVTPTLSLGGIAGNFSEGLSRTIFGTGVVVEDRNRMRQWNDYGIPFNVSKFALTASAEDSVVIGIGVARVLQLCVPLGVPDCGQAPAREAPAGARRSKAP